MSDNNRVGVRVFSIVAIIIIVLVVHVQFFITSVSQQEEQTDITENSELEINDIEVEQPLTPNTLQLPIDSKEVNKEVTRVGKKFIEQDHSFTAHEPHPWELVEVSPVQERLCKDMKLTPLTYEEIYDPDTQQTKRVYSDYYDLNLVILHNGREYSISSVYNEGTEKWIKTQVSGYLNRVYETYSKWLGPEKLFKTDVNIKLALNHTQYFNALAEHDAEESAKVQGVYLPRLHTGFVKIPHNDKNQIQGTRLLQVLVHESVHAINFVQFGYMHRWAQEGLAQYFAHYVDHKTPELFVDYEQWAQRSGHLGEPLSFKELIEPSGHWLENRSALYASSFAYVQYFSSLTQAENHLISVLNTELKQRCSVLNKEWSASQLDPNNQLYTNIQNWFEYTVIYHSDRKADYDKVNQNNSATH